jgi:hypothetical protein
MLNPTLSAKNAERMGTPQISLSEHLQGLKPAVLLGVLRPD